MQKNIAGQKIRVYAFDRTDNTPKTGDAAQITIEVSNDWSALGAITDVNPTEIGNGYYDFNTTQAETNHDNIDTFPESSTLNIQVKGVPETIVPTISAVASDNLTSMYNGTGYTDLTAPSSRSQVDAVGAPAGGAVNIQVTSDNTGGAIIDGITFVGSVQGATTFANTEAADGVYHDIDDAGPNDIDIVYGFSVGGGRTASEVTFQGFVQGNSDEMKISVYDHIGSDWEVVATIPGSNGTSNIMLQAALLLKHTGTGAELGNVYIRLDTQSTSPSNLSVDQLLVAAVSIGQSVGYANGSIWINTALSNTGTESFVDGVGDKPTSLLTSAKTLSASVGIPDFHVVNGSTILLAESTVNESYFGDNWILQLGGQDVADAYFQGARVSGVATSTSEVHFEGCDFTTASIQKGHFDFCGFANTITMTLAGDYNYHNCYSKVAGASAPTFTKTAGQTITGEWRNWSGGLNLTGIESGDIFTIGGRHGTITLEGVDGTVEIRGTYRNIVDNRTGSPVLNTDGATQGVGVADVLEDLVDIKGTGFVKDTNSLVNITGVAAVNWTIGATVS